jgi:hypothetical protein
MATSLDVGLNPPGQRCTLLVLYYFNEGKKSGPIAVHSTVSLSFAFFSSLPPATTTSHLRLLYKYATCYLHSWSPDKKQLLNTFSVALSILCSKSMLLSLRPLIFLVKINTHAI